MVVAPDDLVPIVLEAQHRHAQRRFFGRHERRGSIGGSECLCRHAGIRAAQIHQCNLQWMLAQHDLKRSIRAFVDEERAHGRMPPDDEVPARLEERNVQTSADPPAQLLEVRAGARLHQGMKEHALLHRGQRVDVLDVALVDRHESLRPRAGRPQMHEPPRPEILQLAQHGLLTRHGETPGREQLAERRRTVRLPQDLACLV